MPDRERAKTWIDEMSSNNLDRILYFMNLVLTKEELITEKRNLKNKEQQLISFLEDKIKEINNKLELLESTGSIRISILQSQLKILQEVLDFINKGGKDE